MTARHHEIDVVNTARATKGFPKIPQRAHNLLSSDTISARAKVLACAAAPASSALGGVLQRDGDHAIMTRVLQFCVRVLEPWTAQIVLDPVSGGARLEIPALATREGVLEYMRWRGFPAP